MVTQGILHEGDGPAQPDAPTLGGGEGAAAALSAAELRHLERMLQRERLLGRFMVANLVVASGLTAAYTWTGVWSGVRAALILLLLLGARAHLSQLRSARLLRKLSGRGKPDDERG